MIAKILIFLIIFFLPATAQAHPGGLDSNGGHYCRSNCSQYGLQDGQYHCHTETCTLPSATQTPSSTPTPAPASTQNPTPSPQTSNGNLTILLSEIYPAPNSGEKEWVEVFNPNSQSVDLTNWKFEDAAGNKKSLSGTISPNSFAYFEYSSGWLNNSGDTVSLLDGNGAIVESYSYSEIAKGLAWAKDNSGWLQTSTPTKGGPNQITAPATTEKSSGTSSKSTTNTSTSNTSQSVQPTPKTLGSKSQTGGRVSGLQTDENLASPSLNLATSSAQESSPEASVASSKTSKLGVVLAILGGLVILGAAAFTLVKKLGWKF